MRLPTLAALLLFMSACGSSPAPPAATPAPPPPPAPKPPAAPAAPKPAPKPEAPLSKAPTMPDLEATARTDGLPEGFAEVQKNIASKDYGPALEALKPKLDEAKKGKLAPDHKMLVYALQGFIHAMQNDENQAKASYRRLLPLWGNWRKQVKDIEAAAGDEAKAEPRIALAVDTAGEALFYLADVKHQPRIEQIALPTYEEGADPRLVHRFLDKKVKRFVDGRTLRVGQAEKEYDKLDQLAPKKPGRWLVASASRIGGYHAKVLEELRGLKPPADWKAEGQSTFTDPTKGKDPLAWDAIQKDYAAKIEELKTPVKDNAKKAYERCIALTKEHGVAADDPFAKSCSDWLAANE